LHLSLPSTSTGTKARVLRLAFLFVVQEERVCSQHQKHPSLLVLMTCCFSCHQSSTNHRSNAVHLCFTSRLLPFLVLFHADIHHLRQSEHSANGLAQTSTSTNLPTKQEHSCHDLLQPQQRTHASQLLIDIAIPHPFPPPNAAKLIPPLSTASAQPPNQRTILVPFRRMHMLFATLAFIPPSQTCMHPQQRQQQQQHQRYSAI
jgi:hypothetical protein